jgi:class 3 adenylate cyclase
MITTQDPNGELRLFLEELCCTLCRLNHMVDEGLAPEAVYIAREVQLSPLSEFADIVVTPSGKPAYFVEIKYGLPLEETVRSVRRKYAVNQHASCNRLIVVVRDLDTTTLQARLRDCVCSTLDIEVWDEVRLLRNINARFALNVESLGESDVTELHRSLLRAAWSHIFEHNYYETLASALLWHFSPWTLKRLHDQNGLGPDSIWLPGNYPDVAVVMADISSFSAYVRDTRDDRVMQQVLTAFYSQTRHAVHEFGGMMYQFVGDEVIGLFGFPDRQPGYLDSALKCAKALIDIGASTSEHWQRKIDHVQAKRGVHIGIAMGSLNLMPLRPFARSHIGFIGDALNMTARLMAEAGPSEMVVSNMFYQALDDDTQAEFTENTPIDAKNVGMLRSWRRIAPR